MSAGSGITQNSGSGGSSSFTLYKALLSQTGTANPVIVSLDSGNNPNPFIDQITGITFTRVGIGNYQINATGKFIIGKVIARMSSSADISGPVAIGIDFVSGAPNSLLIVTAEEGAAPSDGLLNYTPIEIEIYP